MSELINNSEKRKDLLKHLILQLHSGEAPEQVTLDSITKFHSVQRGGGSGTATYSRGAARRGSLAIL